MEKEKEEKDNCIIKVESCQDDRLNRLLNEVEQP